MKGQMFTLEAGIAILMVFSAMIFLFRNPPASLEHERINYKMKTYDGLRILEKTGELRKYAVEDNATAINESLSPYIPSFLSYAVVIFDETTNTTPKPSLSWVNESISVSYFLAGDLNDYKPREVRVYLWGYD